MIAIDTSAHLVLRHALPRSETLVAVEGSCNIQIETLQFCSRQALLNQRQYVYGQEMTSRRSSQTGI